MGIKASCRDSSLTICSYHLLCFCDSSVCYRAICDDLENYLSVPSPLTGDTTITLGVEIIECPSLDGGLNGVEVEEVVVEGGTLTIASDNNVQ